jgi:hypothetical protein
MRQARETGETGAVSAQAVAPGETEPGEVDVTRDERGFTVLVRNVMFQLLRALGRKDWPAAAALVAQDREPWPAERFEESLRPFFEEHAAIRLDPGARAPDKTRVTRGGDGVWQIVQVVSDDAGDDDWALFCDVDLDASARDGRPIVVMRGAHR